MNWRAIFFRLSGSGVEKSMSVEDLYQEFRKRMMAEIYASNGNVNATLHLRGDVHARESQKHP